MSEKSKRVFLVGNVYLTIKPVITSAGRDELQVKSEADRIAPETHREYKVTREGELIPGLAMDLPRKELLLDLNDFRQAQELVRAGQVIPDPAMGFVPVVNFKLADTGDTVGLVFTKQPMGKSEKRYFFSHLVLPGMLGPYLVLARLAASSIFR